MSFFFLAALVAGTAAADVRLTGDFGRRLEACYRGSVRTADAKRFTDAFATQAETELWQTEFWGKWMHTAVPLAVYFDDAELKRKISGSADAMRAHQLANGYLGNYAPEARAGYRTWDLWGTKYTLLGFLYEHDLTGNPAALAAAARLVDYTFGEVKARHLDLCRTGNHMGMATLSMLEPLVKLYVRTRDPRYREAIGLVLHEMNGCEKGPFLIDKALRGVHVSERSPLHGKWWWVDNGMKAYEMMSCYQGLFEWYRASGDRRCLDACVATAKDILAREIGIIGSGGIMECWYHFREREGRPITGATETCITTTWMRLLACLLRETGDAAYADALEAAAYNAFSAAMRRDGTGWVQYLPENGRRGEGNLQCGMGTSCCIVNGPRGFLALMDALAVERADGVDLNLYLSSEATVRIPSGTARLVIGGDFPKGDSVKVKVARADGAGGAWSLRLRIPAYCRRPEVRVNGARAADVKAGGYLTLRRPWKTGDEITLTLDQPFRMVFKNRRVAFLKGCVVLARADKFGDGPIEEPILYPPERVPEFTSISSPDGAGMAYSAKLLLGEYTCDKKLRGERSVGFSDWASAADRWGERCAVWLPIPENPEYELSHSDARERPLSSAERRLKDIDPVAAGELRLRPTFVCCGVSYGVGALRTVDFLYRKAGAAEWQTAPKPPYFAETRECRGSLFGLEEDTDYEIRVVVDGAVAKTGRFRTWRSDVPIAKTVVIDPARVRFPIRLRDRGSETGWIRYTVKPGAVVVNRTGSACFIFEGAKCVTLDDVTMRGCGSSFSVIVTNSTQVRIRNCNISHWGRVGEPDYSRKGMRFHASMPTNRQMGINFDGGVMIGERASEVVVERCWIHDPNGRANSWRYCHPAGPEAVLMRRPDHSTVIRWCDFTGSDRHRWNDAVESYGNFETRGGFNRDADVYGNFMNLCNDDCIELDGGQQNVRCFGNRFESALCGVSVQGCIVSPSYVLDNLFSGMGEEFGECGQTIKTALFDRAGVGPWTMIRGNVLWGGGNGLCLDSVWRCARYDVRDNTFCRGQRLVGHPGRNRASNLVSSNNVLGAEIAEADLDTTYPKRPLAFTLDRARLSGLRFGAEEPKPFAVTATSTARAPIAFRIAKNEAFDWFDVTPAKGEIPAGGRTVFTVTPRGDRMRDGRFWRGAFLVRTPEGLSRPFSFEFENASFVEPFRCEKPGELAVYAGAGPFRLTEERTFAFDLREDRRVFFLLRMTSSMNAAFEASVDGSAWSVNHVQGYPGVSNWSVVRSDYHLWGGRFAYFDLKAGRHAVGIRPANRGESLAPAEPILVEGAVMTDSPGSFEPR